MEARRERTSAGPVSGLNYCPPGFLPPPWTVVGTWEVAGGATRASTASPRVLYYESALGRFSQPGPASSRPVLFAAQAPRAASMHATQAARLEMR